MAGTEPATLTIYSMEGQMLYMGLITGHTRYAIRIPQNGKKRFLVIQIFTPEKTSTFNPLNQP